MNASLEEANKELVLKAFDLLFNQRDFSAAEQLFSPHYIQHSAHIPPGRDGLFNLIKNRPASRYENQLAVATGNYVMLHGRFSQRGPGQPNWVAADIVRLEKGLLTEHWDVIQEEAAWDKSKSGLPMFGNQFPGE
jgi:predicted SnoaL-like aldol condensation-catalyzing enzyme